MPPNNGICCELHDLRGILQAPLPSHRILPSHSCWNRGHQVRRRRYSKTVLVNRQTRVAKEGRLNVHVTSDPSTNANVNPAKETSNGEEENCYAVEKVFKHESRPTETYYTVHWYGYESRSTRSSSPSTSLIIFGRRTVKYYESKG